MSRVTMPDPHAPFKRFVAIVGMMAVAILLSVLVFTHTSLRLDESQSLFQVSRPLPDVFYLVAQDVHVPGYHTLLHFWTIFFGQGVETARYLSLVFLLITIPAVYVLGKEAVSTRVGLFAAFLVSLSPFMEWYGSEARMYSMLAMVTVLHQIVFLRLFRNGKPSQWVTYVLLSILGLYTHYFFGFVLITEAVFFVFFRKKFPGRSFRKFAISAAVSLAAFAPWLYYAYSQGAASNTQPSLAAPTSADLFNTYSQFLFGFQVDALNTIIVSLWPIVVLLGFYTLQKNRAVPPSIFFFLMAAVIPVLGAFVVSVTLQPLYLSRYLIVSLPALMLLLAWVFSIYPLKIRRGLQIGLTVIIASLLYVQIANPNTPVKEDYEAATSYLEQQASGQDVIVAAAPFTIYPTEYYYDGSAKLTTQPIWDRFSDGAIPDYNPDTVKQETNKNVLPYQHAWLMLSFDQGYNDKLKAYYDSRFERLTKKEFSPELVVYEYKIRYDPKVTLTSDR